VANTTGLWNLDSLLWQTTTTGLWDFNLHCERRRGRGCMLVRFTTTYAITVYHHWSCEFEFHSRRGVLDTTLCDRHFRTVESRPSRWQTSTTGLSDMGSQPSNKTDTIGLWESQLMFVQCYKSKFQVRNPDCVYAGDEPI